MRYERLFLILSPDCNLRCRYCFQRGDQYIATSFGTPDVDTVATSDVLDRFVHFCMTTGVRHVEFFGGEPLMHMQQFLYVARKLRQQIPDIELGLVTNGTLLTDEVIDVLSSNSAVLLSLDGDQRQHDRDRGGFVRIQPWFNRLTKIHTTIALQAARPEGLHEAIRYIWGIGFKDIYVNIIESRDWYTDSDVDQFGLEYEAAIQDMLSGKGRLDCALKFHASLDEVSYVRGCGIVRRGLACDWRGLFYPCHRAIELGVEFAIGNVDTGIDDAKDTSMRKTIDALVFNSASAQQFPLVSYCPVTVFKDYGRFDGEWNAHYCRMIETKFRLVAKYYHELKSVERSG